MKKNIALSMFTGLALFFMSCQSDEDLDLCTPIPQADCICTTEYEPVCGCDDRTYSNACQAACNNILDYTPGPCD